APLVVHIGAASKRSHQIGRASPANRWYQGSAGLSGKIETWPSSKLATSWYETTVPSACGGSSPRHRVPSAAIASSLAPPSPTRQRSAMPVTRGGGHAVP